MFLSCSDFGPLGSDWLLFIYVVADAVFFFFHSASGSGFVTLVTIFAMLDLVLIFFFDESGFVCYRDYGSEHGYDFFSDFFGGRNVGAGCDLCADFGSGCGSLALCWFWPWFCSFFLFFSRTE